VGTTTSPTGSYSRQLAAAAGADGNTAVLNAVKTVKGDSSASARTVIGKTMVERWLFIFGFPSGPVKVRNRVLMADHLSFITLHLRFHFGAVSHPRRG
jgi:hypothetical protein